MRGSFFCLCKLSTDLGRGEPVRPGRFTPRSLGFAKEACRRLETGSVARATIQHCCGHGHLLLRQLGCISLAQLPLPGSQSAPLCVAGENPARVCRAGEGARSLEENIQACPPTGRHLSPRPGGTLLRFQALENCPRSQSLRAGPSSQKAQV